MAGKIPTRDGLIDAPDRVLVVVAHPDDIDFGSAGSIATMTDAGTHVAYCLVTSGEAGEDDMTMSSQDLAALREAEQTAAGAEVGVSEIHWLHHPDGCVVADLDLRRDIARVIRIVKPDVVISQNPEPDWDRVYRSHPDHLAAAAATMAAVYPDARNPRAHPELLEEGHLPHTAREIWMGGQNPSLVIDIGPVFERKVAALRAHTSQTARMGARLPELLSEWSMETARTAGMSEGSKAEAFRVINSA
jgi:LmbE family N-acetylglucosaminyl deacetylase